MNEKITNQIAEMKKQTIGVEVEMNSITREKAARIAAKFFGTGRYENTAGRNGYYTWSAWDEQGREWKFQSILPTVPYFLIVIADDFHGIQFSAGVLSIDNPKAASVIPMHMNCTCVIHTRNSSLRATWNISVWVIHGNQFNP